jgi:hypothetical protein
VRPEWLALLAAGTGARGSRRRAGRPSRIARHVTLTPLENHALEGMRLGWGINPPGPNVDLLIEGVYGPADGYASRFEAVAIARLLDSSAAMVVQDANGRWHAVKTNFAMDSAPSIAMSEHPLRSLEPIGRLDPGAFELLKQGVRSATTADEKIAAYQRLAAATFGVRPEEIAVIGQGDARVEGKINVNLSPDFEAAGRLGAAGDPGHFVPGLASATELGPDAFESPHRAFSVLLHEEIHAGHYRAAQERYEEYAKRDKTPTVAEFQAWVNTQADAESRRTRGAEGKIAVWDEAMTIGGIAGGRLAATEAHAYLGSFMTTLSGGTPEHVQAATAELLTYGSALGSSKVAVPDGQTQEALFHELERFYQALPESQRGAFDTALETAAKSHPRSWVSAFKHP